MNPILVLENPASWDLQIPGVRVVSARDYLLDPELSQARRINVFNLCRSYEYQSAGYYVSLLATARGQRPFPTLAALQDLRDRRPVRLLSEDVDHLIQRALSHLRSSTFALSIYFGRNLAARYDRLASALFNQFPAPFLRAEFSRRNGRPWRLDRLRVIATEDIPQSHRSFVIAQAERYFYRPRPRRRRAATRYDLAIHVNRGEEDPPSNPQAIRRFAEAAGRLGMSVEIIEKDDAGRILEFDALFIRETTSVNHHTYRLASRAQREGLVVIDDPESIIRCTNKVFQAETFVRAGIPAPRTWIAHEGNTDRLMEEITFPCVVKQPDSSYSRGVALAQDENQLRGHLARYLADSELVVVQQFVPSEFDWRVGILNGEPLHVCRYFMAPGHWTIHDFRARPGSQSGRVETLPADEAPRGAIRLAQRVCRYFGNGLYGVDIKQTGRRFIVIEVNDNPSIDTGHEDHVLGKELYERVMGEFLRRLETRRQRRATRPSGSAPSGSSEP